MSLYQITQEFNPPAQSLLVSAATIKSLVRSSIELLSEQQLATTIWVKLPPTDGWSEVIKQYQQQGHSDLIYLCNTQGNIDTLSSLRRSPSASSQSSSKIIPVELEANSDLEREYFLIILSAQFCTLMLAQQQRMPKKNQFKMVCTFESSEIKQVLAAIKQAIADPLSQESLAEMEFTFPDSVDSALLTNLLLKQTQLIQAEESNPSSKATLAETTTTASKVSTANFQAKLLSLLVSKLQPSLTNRKTALRLLESIQPSKKNQRERYLNYLKHLQRESDREKSLFDGLLELLQLDNSPEGASLQSVKLEDLIPGIVSTYQPLATERGIRLGYTIPRSLPAVSCPSNWLRQILLHLLNNSLKFTPSNGRVSVIASVQDDNVEIVVSDTGVGIENSDFPKIFDPFYQGKNASNQETPGAGLGLTVVKQILQRCNGKISLFSQVGRGSTFKVLLPIVFN